MRGVVVVFQLWLVVCCYTSAEAQNAQTGDAPPVNNVAEPVVKETVAASEDAVSVLARRVDEFSKAQAVQGEAQAVQGHQIASIRQSLASESQKLASEMTVAIEQAQNAQNSKTSALDAKLEAQEAKMSELSGQISQISESMKGWQAARQNLEQSLTEKIESSNAAHDAKFGELKSLIESLSVSLNAHKEQQPVASAADNARVEALENSVQNVRDEASSQAAIVEEGLEAEKKKISHVLERIGGLENSQKSISDDIKRLASKTDKLQEMSKTDLNAYWTATRDWTSKRVQRSKKELKKFYEERIKNMDVKATAKAFAENVPVYARKISTSTKEALSKGLKDAKPHFEKVQAHVEAKFGDTLKRIPSKEEFSDRVDEVADQVVHKYEKVHVLLVTKLEFVPKEHRALAATSIMLFILSLCAVCALYIVVKCVILVLKALFWCVCCRCCRKKKKSKSKKNKKQRSENVDRGEKHVSTKKSADKNSRSKRK